MAAEKRKIPGCEEKIAILADAWQAKDPSAYGKWMVHVKNAMKCSDCSSRRY
jgi:hypothetical protein